MRVYIYQMRPVLFLFYMVETLVNMFVIHFHLKGFIFITMATMDWLHDLAHSMYLVFFYIFTVLTLFACTNLCTGNHTSIIEEVVRPLAGFIIYTICSLMLLGDAESDFYILYANEKPEDQILPEKPLHPYFNYLRAQATSSLVASVVYLLHCLIAVDVLLSNEDSDDEKNSSDSFDDIDEELDYVPVRLYVFGGTVQRWLEQFEWFQEFTTSGVKVI
ncbi:uncharacterized protein LOC108038242 [Drosophila rhopaloa]|uniref:Uncharacterized protein LOC108038242 n=1 Tax=Drosophila rhopaloa TaxID=1041015 RepID=A0A6P4E261_DRORH|nr:uncharacterized protein LOC108038242 [Drosophila rhopaloa]